MAVASRDPSGTLPPIGPYASYLRSSSRDPRNSPNGDHGTTGLMAAPSGLLRKSPLAQTLTVPIPLQGTSTGRPSGVASQFPSVTGHRRPCGVQRVTGPPSPSGTPMGKRSVGEKVVGHVQIRFPSHAGRWRARQWVDFSDGTMCPHPSRRDSRGLGRFRPELGTVSEREDSVCPGCPRTGTDLSPRLRYYVSSA